MISNINDVTWGTRTGATVKKESSPSILTYIKEMEIVGLREIIRTIWYGPEKSDQTARRGSNVAKPAGTDFVQEGTESTDGSSDSAEVPSHSSKNKPQQIIKFFSKCGFQKVLNRVLS